MLSVKMVSKLGLTIAALVLSPPGHVVAIAGLLPPEHPALLIIYSSADEHLPRIRSLKGHILFGRAQAGLVAAHQEIGITIDDFRLEEERPFGVTRRKFVASALNPLSSIHAVSNGVLSAPHHYHSIVTKVPGESSYWVPRRDCKARDASELLDKGNEARMNLPTQKVVRTEAWEYLRLALNQQRGSA